MSSFHLTRNMARLTIYSSLLKISSTFVDVLNFLNFHIYFTVSLSLIFLKNKFFYFLKNILLSF